jgi:membrane protein implicated in regulation of membrane protease activity
LKPTGKVKIEGLPDTCYVLAENGFIEAGSTIKIIQVDGRTVTVRQITA